MPFGAETFGPDGVRFRLYAPGAQRVALAYDTGHGERSAPLERIAGGFFETVCAEAAAGTRYSFEIDGLRAPDPASRFQPDGVHGDSVVVNPHDFDWPDDGWRGLPWHEHVFYEVHVGTFTPQGTYAAAQTKLDYLAALGVTAIELMPLADVPGSRNWGYDGVLPFAPSHNYGTPAELRAFVAAAHARGLAVYLDVVYNHFGPEGNYLHAYAPEFYTERFATPWGAALDFASPEGETVRAFFIENALYWLREYRIDGLRLDAVHAIYDGAERRFLRELAAAVVERNERTVHLILENDANESRLLESAFAAQWNDDAHHAAHVLVTGQRDGYYNDYAARPAMLLARTLTQGFAFQGEPSPFRGDTARGERSAHLPLGAFVTFLQNHDQIGNRPFGERITTLAPAEAVRAAVAVLLLAPSPPLLFMGEEWGAASPFLFFCDFEPELARKVTEGRRSEFATFAEFANPAAREHIPDASALATFERSKLDWRERDREPHRAWLAYYRRLLDIRRTEIAPRMTGVRGTDADYQMIAERAFRVRYSLAGGATLVLEANLGSTAVAEFSTQPGRRVVFATHESAVADALAPPWSVRWTLA